MSDIQRIGTNDRWSDIVIHNSVARWVEVAAVRPEFFRDEVEQVLAQMDATLQRLKGDRTRVLQVLVFVTSLDLVPEFNAQWDTWFPKGHAPVRACVQAALQADYRVELVIEAAI